MYYNIIDSFKIFLYFKVLKQLDKENSKIIPRHSIKTKQKICKLKMEIHISLLLISSKYKANNNFRMYCWNKGRKHLNDFCWKNGNLKKKMIAMNKFHDIKDHFPLTTTWELSRELPYFSCHSVPTLNLTHDVLHIWPSFVCLWFGWVECCTMTINQWDEITSICPNMAWPHWHLWLVEVMRETSRTRPCPAHIKESYLPQMASVDTLHVIRTLHSL